MLRKNISTEEKHIHEITKYSSMTYKESHQNPLKSLFSRDCFLSFRLVDAQTCKVLETSQEIEKSQHLLITNYPRSLSTTQDTSVYGTFKDHDYKFHQPTIYYKFKNSNQVSIPYKNHSKELNTELFNGYCHLQISPLSMGTKQFLAVLKRSTNDFYFFCALHCSGQRCEIYVNWQ